MSDIPMLDCIELKTADSPKFSVIWMHGLGAEGSDFVPVIPELGLQSDVGIRFIFPNAPEIPVTCNAGYVMPAGTTSFRSTARRELSMNQAIPLPGGNTRCHIRCASKKSSTLANGSTS